MDQKIVDDRWNEDAKHVAEFALREALALGHNYIGAEHLLLGALRRLPDLDAHEKEKMRNLVVKMLADKRCPHCDQPLPK